MEMIVCVKQVPDPEANPATFSIEPGGRKISPPPGVPPVLSTFDECALEAALRIKDAFGGRITVLCLGADLLREVVKKTLAMGADRLILLEDEAFEGGDSWSTAHALAKAIEKIGVYDLIFCGRQAADWDAGQVGIGIAELLQLPAITVARKVETVEGKVRAERITSDGYELIEADMPALITVSGEIGQPRYTTMAGIMTAGKKEISVWKPKDIGLDPSQAGAAGRRLQLLELFQPVREGECEIIERENPEDAGISLALKLREAKLL